MLGKLDEIIQGAIVSENLLMCCYACEIVRLANLLHDFVLRKDTWSRMDFNMWLTGLFDPNNVGTLVL